MSSTSTTLFPLLTPSVLYACRDASVPVVATVHNYKLSCASGALFRDGRGLPRLPGGSSLPALARALLPRLTRLDGPCRTRFAGCTPRAWRTMVTCITSSSPARQRDLASHRSGSQPTAAIRQAQLRALRRQHADDRQGAPGRVRGATGRSEGARRS